MGDATGTPGRSAAATDPGRGPWWFRLAAWSAAGLALVAALAATAVYTEQSSFCPTCHEMRPYYMAWRAGGHAVDAQCVDCHVDAGLVAHLEHKPIALKEVWDHFLADNRFPNYSVSVPDSRCVGCHATVKVASKTTFSHDIHASRARCQECHASTGHTVSLASLRAAGVLKAFATTPPVPARLRPSAIAGHIKVVCQECHDQAAMECADCHQPPHDELGDCSNCHKPGREFVFSHGGSGQDCAQCHTPPAGHFGAGCPTCHSTGVPFEKTVFTHPAAREHGYRSFACVKCHPKGYSSSSCTCHGGSAPAGD